MNEEIVQILNMVKDGKITSEEGENLISIIVGEEDPVRTPPKKMLRMNIEVNDEEDADSTVVKVNVPLAIAKHAANLISLTPKNVQEELIENGIDLKAMDIPGLLDMFANGEISEELINVQTGDEKNGVKVRIYVD